MLRGARPFRRILAAAAAAAVACCPAIGQGAHDLLFREVGPAAGIGATGLSNGASWGDFDADGWPDLWTGNHDRRPSLYLNDRDGTFTDIILQVWSADPYIDTHGAAWADWDNDGDQDLLEMVGADHGTGGTPNLAFVNDGGLLEDRAVALGLDYPLGRGRTPLWLDMDRDGLLDVVLCNRKRDDGLGPSTILRQEGGAFLDVGAQVGFAIDSSPHYALLSDLSGDGRLDLVVPGYPWPAAVYDLGGPILTDLLPGMTGLPVAPGSLVKDAVAEDFDGDLRPDLFLIGDNGGPDAVQADAYTIEMSLKTAAATRGIDFTGSGMIGFQIVANPWLPREQIFLGAAGLHPDHLTFALNAKLPEYWGLADPDTLPAEAMSIGYDPQAKTWRLQVRSGIFLWTNAVIRSEGPTTLVQTLGFKPFTPSSTGQLILNRPAGFATAKVGGIMAGGSVAAGDFDNDMDVDLFVVASTPLVNLPDILYENLGDGTFAEVPGAAGAAGTDLGLGESVAVADYDRDGFLDLVVTNGADYPPFADDGPCQLFHNVSGLEAGNANHWLQVDLQGTQSNRDGIGASVTVYAGGKAQLRERGGGMHLYSQNFARLHFGLGPYALADSVIVAWPSGVRQRIVGQPADGIITVVEPAAKDGPDAPSPSPAAVVAARLGPARPNPFNPRTTIEFELDRPAAVRLDVLDVRGRLVAVLAAGEHPAGVHRVRWDGRDLRGRPAPSGQYLCRLSAGRQSLLQKMTLCR